MVGLTLAAVGTFVSPRQRCADRRSCSQAFEIRAWNAPRRLAGLFFDAHSDTIGTQQSGVGQGVKNTHIVGAAGSWHISILYQTHGTHKHVHKKKKTRINSAARSWAKVSPDRKKHCQRLALSAMLLEQATLDRHEQRSRCLPSPQLRQRRLRPLRPTHHHHRHPHHRHHPRRPQRGRERCGSLRQG